MTLPPPPLVGWREHRRPRIAGGPALLAPWARCESAPLFELLNTAVRRRIDAGAATSAVKRKSVGAHDGVVVVSPNGRPPPARHGLRTGECERLKNLLTSRWTTVSRLCSGSIQDEAWRRGGLSWRAGGGGGWVRGG